jgi:hypothetical protein
MIKYFPSKHISIISFLWVYSKCEMRKYDFWAIFSEKINQGRDEGIKYMTVNRPSCPSWSPPPNMQYTYHIHSAFKGHVASIPFNFTATSKLLEVYSTLGI